MNPNTTTPQKPDFLSIAQTGGKSVGAQQREWAARTATPGTVPVVLTEALERESKLRVELASAEAAIQQGIVLTDRWNALLARRDLLAKHVERGHELLSTFNPTSTGENAGLDNLIETGSQPMVIFGELVKLSAIPFALDYFGKYCERKSEELAKAQADVASFAKDYKIKL